MKNNSIITIFILIIIVLFTIVFTSIFVFSNTNQDRGVPNGMNNNNGETKNGSIVIESDKFNTYRNYDFGFEFDYPDNWEIYEDSFLNTDTLYNLTIAPINEKFLPYPIIINVINKDRIEKILNENKNLIAVSVYDREGVLYKNEFMGLPQLDYIFPFDGGYIIIGGKEKYEDVLNQVLNSFKFLDK